MKYALARAALLMVLLHGEVSPGGHNNLGNTSGKTSPIYTIGSSYNPDETTLSNMYGIGFSHINASFINVTGGSGWGMYVASDGDARIFLDASGGKISSTGEHYVGSSRVFHDTYHPNADTLTTARTIALSGAVTGSASFNGGSNITIATTNTADPTLTLAGDATGAATFTNLGNATLTVAVANDSHTHDGRYYTETETSGFLNLKANLASPALTGNPTAPTQAANNNSTRIATTAYVQTEIGDYSTSANSYRRTSQVDGAVSSAGWVTVATNTSGRKHGEVIVSDSDSGDHAFIRIDWMRSYADSNFSVLQVGGHSNNITGVRVLYQTSDNTYGTKLLQVYVTTGSTYGVRVHTLGSPRGYAAHGTVTPVIENTKSGYAVHGSALENLNLVTLAHEYSHYNLVNLCLLYLLLV